MNGYDSENIHRYNAMGNLFEWKSGIGVADASDIGLPPGKFPHCIAITSHKTGNTRFYFYVGREDQHIRYSDVFKNKVYIFND